MDRPPYEAGERVLVQTADGQRRAVVSVCVETTSLDAQRRWRVLCRWEDEAASVVDDLLHCGDDGIGDRIRPADQFDDRVPAGG